MADKDRVVGGNFKMGRKIGAGSFGELFLGELINFHYYVLLMGGRDY